MAKFLLRSTLPLIFLIACSPSSRNASSSGTSNNHVQGNIYANRTQPPVESLLPVDTSGHDQQDSLLSTKPLSLMDLPQTDDGEVVLSEGFYEADFKSYCLQPGTPSPSDRDAYRQGPLTSYRRDIVETILRNSLKRPDLEQRNIQLLLWSVVSGSDYRKLSWEVQSTAQQLLTRKQTFELQGGVMGIVKTVSMALPETGATNQMRQLFEMGTNSYEAYERIAVLQQSSQITRTEIKKDQWYKQPDGYWLRYFPSSYQHVKIQVYVPKGTIEKNSEAYLLFDPVTMMAIPANSNSQRLGIGAPVIDVVRKIIQIQRVPPPTKRPPVKSQNPKQVVMK
ncbi:MAG TPA: hypothetical protein VFP87_08465 [Chitinophagaceae bacterium]|nr:hypothetical protein [Chitinophagaceae bacterium]